MCITVIPCGRDIVFLFGSHSRNREGRPDPNEYSVLLKFPDSVAVGNYVISCYCQGNTVQFEVQFIAVHLEQFSASFCSRLVRNLKNWIQNLNFAPVFAIDQIENVQLSPTRKNKFQLQKSYYVSDHIRVNDFPRWLNGEHFIFVVFIMDVFTEVM